MLCLLQNTIIYRRSNHKILFEVLHQVDYVFIKLIIERNFAFMNSLFQHLKFFVHKYS